jgi:hypothetical protein
MARDDMENNFVHIRRTPERSREFWQARLAEIEARHARKRRVLDSAISDYQSIATAMGAAQAEEHKHPAGRDPQAQFGAELEQARLKVERERISYHGARVADLERLSLEVSHTRDQLIAEVAAADALGREVGAAAEAVRTKLWYAALERDQAANYIQISDAAREAQQRAARELPEEKGRGNYYGRGYGLL